MYARLFAVSLAVLLLGGCASLPNPLAGPAQGATSVATPTAPSAAAKSSDPRVATLVGSGFGTLSGADIGSYIDREEGELRTDLRSTGVSVNRAGNQIVLILPAALAFDADKSAVRQPFTGTLVSIGVVLKKYEKSIVDVYGYTDDQGDDTSNKSLSQRRAVAVATMISNQGVDQRRFYIEGRGEADPLTSNATETGRAQNRRVAIQISPLT